MLGISAGGNGLQCAAAATWGASLARWGCRASYTDLATSINGKDIPMRADCICVHSDTPGAVDIARVVFEVLQPHLGKPAPRAAAAAAH